MEMRGIFSKTKMDLVTIMLMKFTQFRAESEEELKSLLLKVKEESEKVGLKIMASGPITSWEINGETVPDFIFGGLQNHCR